MLRLFLVGAAAAVVTTGSVADTAGEMGATRESQSYRWSDSVVRSEIGGTLEIAADDVVAEIRELVGSASPLDIVQVDDLRTRGALERTWAQLPDSWGAASGESRRPAMLGLEMASLNRQTAHIGAGTGQWPSAKLDVPMVPTTGYAAYAATNVAGGSGNESWLEAFARETPVVLTLLGFCVLAIAWPIVAIKLRL